MPSGPPTYLFHPNGPSPPRLGDSGVGHRDLERLAHAERHVEGDVQHVGRVDMGEGSAPAIHGRDVHVGQEVQRDEQQRRDQARGGDPHAAGDRLRRLVELEVEEVVGDVKIVLGLDSLRPLRRRRRGRSPVCLPLPEDLALLRGGDVRSLAGPRREREEDEQDAAGPSSEVHEGTPALRSQCSLSHVAHRWSFIMYGDRLGGATEPAGRIGTIESRQIKRHPSLPNEAQYLGPRNSLPGTTRTVGGVDPPIRRRTGAPRHLRVSLRPAPRSVDLH